MSLKDNLGNLICCILVLRCLSLFFTHSVVHKKFPIAFLKVFFCNLTVDILIVLDGKEQINYDVDFI